MAGPPRPPKPRPIIEPRRPVVEPVGRGSVSQSPTMQAMEMLGRPPRVNDVGLSMAGDFNLINPKSSAFNQTESNCASIGCKLAEEFGFDTTGAIDSVRSRRDSRGASQLGWSHTVAKELSPSDAYLIVRQGETFADHISFEYRNKEYNFGPGDKEGYKIVDRIPLRRKGEVVREPVPQRGITEGLRYVDNQLAKIAPQSKMAATQVLDENGVPRRLYHITDFVYDTPDVSFSQAVTHGSGFYASESPPTDKLEGYRVGGKGVQQTNVRPVYLDIRNPFDMRDADFVRTFVGENGASVSGFDRKMDDGRPVWNALLTSFANNPDRVRASIESAGYDGIVDSPSTETFWVAFSSNQIHPAILTSEARNVLFRKLLGQGLSVALAAAIVALRDSEDDAPVSVPSPRPGLWDILMRRPR